MDKQDGNKDHFWDDYEAVVERGMERAVWQAHVDHVTKTTTLSPSERPTVTHRYTPYPVTTELIATG